MVVLVWSAHGLPIVTNPPIWLYSYHVRPLPIITSAIRHDTQYGYYVGLELVVYGAVELGDVVLFFVGEQGLFGLEVYTRLVGQTDGVCDTGILATGLH